MVSLNEPTTHRVPLRDIAALLLRLGFIAFGGPAAHVAMMKREMVERLGWMSSVNSSTS